MGDRLEGYMWGSRILSRLQISELRRVPFSFGLDFFPLSFLLSLWLLFEGIELIDASLPFIIHHLLYPHSTEK